MFPHSLLFAAWMASIWRDSSRRTWQADFTHLPGVRRLCSEVPPD